MLVGIEWLIEATGCDPEALRDEVRLKGLFEIAIDDLGLSPIGAVWHKFPGEGGVTGLIALTESHLACHTYPEHGTATFNLYCCRERPEWDWENHLERHLGAGNVRVTRFERGDESRNRGFDDSEFRSGCEFPNFRSEISNLESGISGGAA